MKKHLTLAVSICCLTTWAFAQQNPLDVTDQTIKIGAFKEEELLFGFAEGDKVMFSFEEVNKKDLKEVEILEYPSNSKFSDYKTNKAEKTFSVSKQGVYVFRFKNSALGGRVCKIRIMRVPASDITKNFNSTVTWVVRQDTTWNTFTKDVVIGYDTINVSRTQKELVRVDTVITQLFDKMLRVHSATAFGKSQYTTIQVDLPKNEYYPNVFDPYRTKEVLAWSYWMGVGQKSDEEYEKANKKLASGVKVLGALTGYGALAMLAATGISVFGTPNVGDNVSYKFFGILNGNEIVIDYGNVVSASARNERIKQGSFNLELFNDNVADGIDVNVKMVALVLNKTWENKSYTEQRITPKYEKQLFREPLVNTNKVAVAGL